MIRKTFFCIFLLSVFSLAIAAPLDEVFSKGEYVMTVQEGQSGAMNAGTFSAADLEAQRKFFNYLENKINEKPAIGYFLIKRFVTLPNCGLILSVPVAPIAHKMITKINGAPLGIQYAVCADGSFPADNDEIKQVKAEQHAAGTQTPAEISKMLHKQYDAALKKAKVKQ